MMVTVDDLSKSQERYTLTHLHASGGIGRIWLARDTAFGRNVALKELRPEHAALAAHRTRFLQEARITGQLEHPGTVPVYVLARGQRSGAFTQCASSKVALWPRRRAGTTISTNSGRMARLRPSVECVRHRL
jgi:serine/threonine protein kinase